MSNDDPPQPYFTQGKGDPMSLTQINALLFRTQCAYHDKYSIPLYDHFKMITKLREGEYLSTKIKMLVEEKQKEDQQLCNVSMVDEEPEIETVPPAEQSMVELYGKEWVFLSDDKASKIASIVGGAAVKKWNEEKRAEVSDAITMQQWLHKWPKAKRGKLMEAIMEDTAPATPATPEVKVQVKQAKPKTDEELREELVAESEALFQTCLEQTQGWLVRLENHRFSCKLPDSIRLHSIQNSSRVEFRRGKIFHPCIWQQCALGGVAKIGLRIVEHNGQKIALLMGLPSIVNGSVCHFGIFHSQVQTFKVSVKSLYQPEKYKQLLRVPVFLGAQPVKPTHAVAAFKNTRRVDKVSDRVAARVKPY